MIRLDSFLRIQKQIMEYLRRHTTGIYRRNPFWKSKPLADRNVIFGLYRFHTRLDLHPRGSMISGVS
jgi:hypothetical protein